MSRPRAALAAELIKLRSIRSTRITVAVTVGLTIVLAPVTGWTTRIAIDTHNPALRPDFSPVRTGFSDLRDATLGLIVFGVLSVTQEYTSGMIRTSLMAVPQRARFLAAKMAAVALVALLVAIPLTVLSFTEVQLLLGPHGASLLASQVPRALAGCVVYLVLVSLFAAGFAAIVRSPVVSLTTLLPLFTFAPMILKAVGATKDVVKFLPADAGMQMMAVGPDLNDGLSPAAGLAVFTLWTIAALAGGYLILRVRDA